MPASIRNSIHCLQRKWTAAEANERAFTTWDLVFVSEQGGEQNPVGRAFKQRSSASFATSSACTTTCTRRTLENIGEIHCSNCERKHAILQTSACNRASCSKDKVAGTISKMVRRVRRPASGRGPRGTIVLLARS
jgi:hypothetical protein